MSDIDLTRNLPDADRCGSTNPATGSQCSMAEGHFGAHNVGGPYPKDQEETWVTKCEDGMCEFHQSTVGVDAGSEVCIHCGAVRPMEGLSDAQRIGYAAEREKKWKSIAAELRREAKHWNGEAARMQKEALECVQQTMERDKLIDMMADNLGLARSERFLYDRHTQAIAQEHARYKRDADQYRVALQMAVQALRGVVMGQRGTGGGMSLETLNTVVDDISKALDGKPC